ncbi:4-coumarate-CoA ligase-like 7 [Smittium mucronatum]|uniref:4-coumarate-CoA ligase-like 7 n=1 Tax=Smittium mucronatum TaxID=133383 RepID=A0A1R0GS08_9FUNG|nr:4-coumarate-CoA ligase-like 7 [Smittium mucronatum]
MIFRSKLPNQEIPVVDVATFIFEEGKKNVSLSPLYEYSLFDQETGESLTIDGLEEKCTRLASGLQNQLGMKTDQVSLVFSTNSLAYTVLIFSTIMTGGILTLANPTMNKSELSFQIKDSKTQYIYTKLELLTTVKAAIQLSKADIPDCNIILIDSELSLNGCTSMKQLYSSLPFNRFLIRDLEAAKKKTAFLPYSSGTTGIFFSPPPPFFFSCKTCRFIFVFLFIFSNLIIFVIKKKNLGFPKGVVLSHYNIVANTIQISYPSRLNGWFTSKNPVKYLAVLPYYHIYGLVIITCVGLSNVSKHYPFTLSDPPHPQFFIILTPPSLHIYTYIYAPSF